MFLGLNEKYMYSYINLIAFVNQFKRLFAKQSRVWWLGHFLEKSG